MVYAPIHEILMYLRCWKSLIHTPNIHNIAHILIKILMVFRNFYCIVLLEYTVVTFCRSSTMPKKKKRQHNIPQKSPRLLPTLKTTKTDQHVVKQGQAREIYYFALEKQVVDLDCLPHTCFLVDYKPKEGILGIDKYTYLREGLCISLVDQYAFHFPQPENSRVIGKPRVIASLSDILVLQYICESEKYMKFTVVNCLTGALKHFNDGTKYFKKDLMCAGTIDCHVTASKEGECKMFARLPESLLSKQKSLVLTTEWNIYSEKSITDLVKYNLQAHRFQAIAVNPGENFLFIAEVDVFCEKITLQKLNLNGASSTKVGHIRKKVDVQQLARPGTGDSLTLTHVSMALNQSRDFLVICMKCTLTPAFNSQTSDKCFVVIKIIDPETLDSLNESVNEVRLHETVNAIIPVFSPCGSVVKVMGHMAHGKYYILSERTLPKLLMLQNFCRTVILNLCTQAQVNALGLPQKLEKYLLFQPQ